MVTILEQKLADALTKARNVGVFEEAFTIGGVDLVLRNLRPEEYSAALKECEGLDATEYLVRYQKGHISRSIIEVNGVDLRDVKFVSVDETDAAGKTRKVKRELHQYLNDNLLESWGKEAVYTVMRKFWDVVEQAEQRAKDGIKFILAEETPEEKYRRLMLEAQSVESDLPDSLIDSIHGDLGLMRKSTAEEIQRAMEKADQIEAKPEAEKAPEPAPVVERPQPAPAARVIDPHVTLQRAIEARKAAPQPPGMTPSEPEEVVQRSAAIAVLEGLGNDAPSEPVEERVQTIEAVEIKPRLPVDPKAAATILDQAPVAGVNMRFRPPPRL